MTAHSIFNYVDLTYLGSDQEEARYFIDKAATKKMAAICISPQFVQIAKKKIAYPVASVVNFPNGEAPDKQVLLEIRELIKLGVDEIDIVFSYQTYLNGEEANALKRMAHYLDKIPSHIIKKVIIEAGELKDQRVIHSLCEALIKLPIDFIKTSTGKTAVGATLESAQTILSCINDTTIGLKVSGGIRTIETAKTYLDLAESLLQEKPLSASRFRIGASQLTEA